MIPEVTQILIYREQRDWKDREERRKNSRGEKRKRRQRQDLPSHRPMSTPPPRPQLNPSPSVFKGFILLTHRSSGAERGSPLLVPPYKPRKGASPGHEKMMAPCCVALASYRPFLLSVSSCVKPDANRPPTSLSKRSKNDEL